MSGTDPLPPWAMHPGTRYEAFWIESCDPHVHSTWLPFWKSLSEGQRADHLARFPPPPGWQAFLDDVALDQEWERIDAEDIASGVLQPNGSPWPRPKASRPRFWARLSEWLRSVVSRSPGRS